MEALGRAHWHLESAGKFLIEPGFAAACDDKADQLTHLLNSLVVLMGETRQLREAFHGGGR